MIMYPYIQLQHLKDNHFLNYIYANTQRNYYVSDDWSINMYDTLAFSGFISVSATDDNNKEYLIPEIQFSYAVLHWENIHISKRFKDFIKKKVLPNDDFYISINTDIDAVFEGIDGYHSDNWMGNQYRNVLKKIYHSTNNHFINILSIELWHKNCLIAGEIGYMTGNIYTSLSGFFDRRHYSNFGKLQLLSLALLLKHSGVAFWNMGHPYMKYKFDLGAKKYQRNDFLKLWIKFRTDAFNCPFIDQKINCNELLIQEDLK